MSISRRMGSSGMRRSLRSSPAVAASVEPVDPTTIDGYKFWLRKGEGQTVVGGEVTAWVPYSSERPAFSATNVGLVVPDEVDHPLASSGAVAGDGLTFRGMASGEAIGTDIDVDAFCIYVVASVHGARAFGGDEGWSGDALTGDTVDYLGLQVWDDSGTLYARGEEWETEEEIENHTSGIAVAADTKYVFELRHGSGIFALRANGTEESVSALSLAAAALANQWMMFACVNSSTAVRTNATIDDMIVIADCPSNATRAGVRAYLSTLRGAAL